MPSRRESVDSARTRRSSAEPLAPIKRGKKAAIMTSACYPKPSEGVCIGQAVLQPQRTRDRTLEVPSRLPGAIILVHGVNDVGTGYAAVESGLCQGLNERLVRRDLNPASYRLPTEADKDKLEPDPDDVFFERRLEKAVYSPVIPFYWGYREEWMKAKTAEQTVHGQAIDRYGNRLDKDLSKGGGPFANATTTLADMWNSGAPALGGLVDSAKHDAIRPVLGGPGRLYMVLAALRLAAIVAMLRDRHAQEPVSLVAHSQGCLVSLLAQAFLLDKGQRPADTLVLTHPPYSLETTVVERLALNWRLPNFARFGGGRDALMDQRGGYDHLKGAQTLHARLETLARIVQGVHRHKSADPPLAELGDAARHAGVASAGWQPGNDRDNRGSVFLYFCPEDMTVGLRNVQGIGWQGVPDAIEGLCNPPRGGAPADERREPLAALGPGFFQRVFTKKKRPDAAGGSAPLVGAAPQRFVLRTPGEPDHAHVGPDTAGIAVKHLQEGASRMINAPALRQPTLAQMHAGAVDPAGRQEAVDPLDASIAPTSDYGRGDVWLSVDDPETSRNGGFEARDRIGSPHPASFPGPVADVTNAKRDPAQQTLNRDQPAGKRREVLEVYQRLIHNGERFVPDGKLLLRCTETGDESRLRWQHATAERSFHGAIFGGDENHRRVTAYDVSIGSGIAVSDRGFYEYVCAVADWRLQQDKRLLRPGVMQWDKFLAVHGRYYNAEPDDRKLFINACAKYYSTGELPSELLLLPDGLPSAVVCETLKYTPPIDHRWGGNVFGPAIPTEKK